LLANFPLPVGKTIIPASVLPPPLYNVTVLPSQPSPSSSSVASAVAASAISNDATSDSKHAPSGLNLFTLPLSLPPFGQGVMRYTPVPVRLVRNVRLTSPDNEQDVRHI